MTLQELEFRLGELELQVAELKRDLKPLRAFHSESETYGLFANDPDFDEVLRLGREFRRNENAEDASC